VCRRGGAAAGGGQLVFLFFVFEKNLRRQLIAPLGAYPPRGVPRALGEGAFTGGVWPRGLHRELPLGEAITERKLTLGEGLDSGSVSHVSVTPFPSLFSCPLFLFSYFTTYSHPMNHRFNHKFLIQISHLQELQSHIAETNKNQIK
jgi:hypothetical protein